MIVPKDFLSMIRNPATKAAFLRESQVVNSYDCENCGGSGHMHIFIAIAGPFENPPGGQKIGHWGKGKFKEGWWEGNTFSGICPVCGGLGKKKEAVEAQVNPVHRQEALEKMGTLSQKMEIEPRLPYADN